MARRNAFKGNVDRLGPQLLLIWAGLSIGVAFLATPAKFLAPSLSLPVALDVGRQTFQLYNRTELVLLVALAMLGGWSKNRRHWYLVLTIPGLVVMTQALWLLPALGLRVSAIEAGATHLPPSNLHWIYIAAEAVKVVSLLACGLVGSDRRPKPFPIGQRDDRASNPSPVSLQPKEANDDAENSDGSVQRRLRRGRPY